MCAYRPRGDNKNRPYPARSRDDFYDDRRSQSPPGRSNSSPRRRSPPHDIPRGPSQRYNRDDQRDRDGHGSDSRGYQDRSHDRREYSDRRHNSPPRRGNNTYRDWDRRSPSRSRSMSRESGEERSSSRGQPSKEIMMEGLAQHLTENDVRAPPPIQISTELKQHYNVKELDDVRIIRDRQTKQSREFGFLRFPAIEQAEAFMNANYPTIYLYGNSDDAQGSDEAKVRIAYGKERKDPRGDDGDWICKICNINNFATRARCFRCQTLRPDPATIQKPANTGDNDAAPDNIPSQFLLLRGLESSVSDELFAKGVAKLNKPSGTQTQASQPQSKKGAKVASTTGDANLGAKDGTLRRVLLVRDRKTNDSWKYGFAEYASIDDAQAALTRYNSFDRFTIASKQVIVSYIHAGVFVPVLSPTPANERFNFSPLANPAMKLAYWDEEAYVTEFVVSAPEILFNDKINPKQIETEGLKNTKDVEKTKKRKAQEATQVNTKKAAPSHLQFWSNRHAELHGIKKTGNSPSDKSDPTAPPSKSYADPSRNCCYLCMRQFNSTAEVNKHERLSGLHRQNLKDTTKAERAEHKLEKHGIQDPTTQTAEYRDRARERRKVYGVVNKKGEQVGGKGSKVSRPIRKEDDEPTPVQSKGAALLSKMGYTAGQGLGASGEGMTAPISQDVYMAGVGLGAEGGKLGDAVAEAQRNTKSDYGAFAEQTRERARERYNKMGG